MNNPEDSPARQALAELQQAIALHRGGRLAQAVAGYDRALALRPAYADAYNNRAAALRSLGDLEGAVESYDQAIALGPGRAVSHANRALALLDLGRFDDAIEASRRAIALDADEPAPRAIIARAMLLRGDWREGWPLWDRWRKGGRLAVPPEKTPRDLSDLNGKRVLAYQELGLGDTILFSRYVAALRSRGAAVTLGLSRSLMGLMSGVFAGVTVVDRDTIPAATQTDWFCALPSLPGLFGTTLETVPEGVRLLAEPERVAAWRRKLGSHGFKIGICWQGATKGGDDVGRSFPVALFETISRLPGVRLISLHKGEGQAQLDALPAGMVVETLGEFDTPLDAFLDTAAVMTTCDLVITSDTAVAHLAGALGVPTWLALKRVPAFIWLMDRPDSPWYPSLRLFRQATPGDWPGVFRAMEEELRALRAARG